MPPITIDVFSEGKTEREIAGKLCRRGICPHELKERGGGGEQEMLRKLSLLLRNWFDLAQEQRELLRILVLRDLDEGRTIDGLCESTLNVVRRHHTSARLISHLNYDHVFTLQTDLSGLRLALHIANHRYHQEFIKSTIDDYVLNLALRPATAEALLQNCRKEDWIITTDKLVSKVRDEIPELLRQNGIPKLVEAKVYVRLYAALLQMATTPAIFAGKVLEHAQTDDVQEVFAPLLAAVHFLGSDSTSI